MLALDVNTRNTQTAGSGTIQSPAFSTNFTNELLLAFIGISSNSATVSSVTGGGVTWIFIGRSTVQGFAMCEVWRAFSTTTLSNQTITANSSSATTDMYINIVSISNADRTGANGAGAIGATLASSVSGALVSTAITTTRNNSWVLMVVADGTTGSPTITAPVGQTIIDSWKDTTDSITFWTQRQNLTTYLSGTAVTMNDTSPASDSCNIFALEILENINSRVQGSVMRPRAFAPGVAR